MAVGRCKHVQSFFFSSPELMCISSFLLHSIALSIDQVCSSVHIGRMHDMVYRALWHRLRTNAIAESR